MGADTRLEPVSLDGDAGMLVYRDGGLATVIAFGIEDEIISTISILADPIRLVALSVP